MTSLADLIAAEQRAEQVAKRACLAYDRCPTGDLEVLRPSHEAWIAARAAVAAAMNGDANIVLG